MREQVITREIIANPKSKYGDAKASTRHFITQRVTGAINIALVGFLVWLVVRLAGTARADMVGVIGTPAVGIVLAVLLVVALVHMRNGMRDVLEDYFAGSVYRLYMTLNTGFTLLVGAIGLVSIFKLIVWG